jgi:hypothetical protein
VNFLGSVYHYEVEEYPEHRVKAPDFSIETILNGGTSATKRVSIIEEIPIKSQAIITKFR